MGTPDRISALIRKGRETRASSPAMKGRSKKAAVCRPRRGPSPRTKCGYTLILNFLASRTVGNVSVV